MQLQKFSSGTANLAMIQFLEKFIFIGNYPATVITRDDRQEIFRGKESKNCLKGKKMHEGFYHSSWERETDREEKKERKNIPR